MKDQFTGTFIATAAVLERLIDSNIIKHGHFIGTSGPHLDTYIAKDKIICNPDLFVYVLGQMMSVILRMRLDGTFDVITGPAVAGAIIAAPLADRLKKTLVYPEKIDGKMVFRRGYDKVISGKKVAIIEDVLTTGGSVRKTIEAVKECGGEPRFVLAIWNRGVIQSLGVPVFCLVNQKLPSWKPDECPMCKNGLPIESAK